MAGKSIHYDCLLGIQTIVAALPLTLGGVALASSSIIIRALPKVGEKVDVLPMIAIAPGNKESIVTATSGKDDYYYPCNIVIIANASGNYNAIMEDLLSWRGLVLDKFNNTNTLALSAAFTTAGIVVYDIDILLEAIIDAEKLNSQYWYSGITVIAKVRKARNQGKG